jgi:hypothetical protein
MKNEPDKIDKLVNCFKIFNRMQALLILNNDEWLKKTKGEKIIFLHCIGFGNDEISQMVDTTLGMVKKEISVRKNE